MILLHKLGRPINMDDAIDVNAIPDDAKLVAGYVDGNWPDYPELVRRFHGRADLVSIGIYLGSLADFTDVEPGNPIKTPALVRADFEYRRAHGVWRPGYYADRTRMANTVLPGLTGLRASEYRLWLADWTNRKHIPPGYAACQYESLSRPNIDISLVDPALFYPPDAKPKRGAKRPGKIHAPAPLRHVHPSVPVAGGSTGLAALLAGLGVHLTPAEWALLGSVLTALTAQAKHLSGGR